MSNRSNRPRTLRARFLALALLAFALLAGIAPSASAQDEDATALLNKAVQTMSGVQSFEFDLSTVQGQSTILQNLELEGVTGEVKRPDRFHATITAKVAIIEVTVDVIGIGNRVWVTDPMARTKTFIEVTSGDPAESQTLTDLLNPDRVLLQAVGILQNPTIDGTEEIDGVETTRIVGTVDLSKLPQFQATPEAGSDILTLTEMPITIWIDNDGHVVSMELEGPLTKSESPDVVRRLDLFNFDEPVDITEPAATAVATAGA